MVLIFRGGRVGFWWEMPLGGVYPVLPIDRETISS